ncbi:hypothetical protein M5K25_020618 [Dendrobium thyrsiflorum]|uniref:Uncharacterized protein n=1 Tax=Dendrobium thyrsiflorum TaxID=117978 RepID=A0ABD0UB54_DENTH
MSPDQGLEALLEGSNHNSDYQTVSKFYDLIVESSGSTRQIQRAQEHRNPTSLRIQYRPSIPNHSFFPLIYLSCHSRKSINRAPFLLQNGLQSQSLKRSRERSKTALAPLLLLDHRRNIAGPPPEGPTLPPDNHLKALNSARPPPKGPTVCRTTT